MAQDSRLISDIRKKRAGDSVPLDVTIELTHKCNLACRHCYLAPSNGQAEMSTVEWRRLLGQLRDCGTFVVSFTGGEVFTRLDFFDIVAHARDLGLFYSFMTNGTLVTSEVARDIRDANPAKVDVSLYGARAETHDAVTMQPGSFDRTVEALRLLAEQEVRTIVKTTVMASNCAEIADIRALARSLGAGLLADPMVAPRADGSSDPLRYRIDDAELREFMVREGWSVACETRDADGKREPALERLMCAAGKSRCAVSPSGEVYPCVLWRQPAGSVRTTNFESVWSGPLFECIRSVTDAALPRCSVCRMRHACVRCPGFAYLENRDFLGSSSEVCRMTRVLTEVMSIG